MTSPCSHKTNPNNLFFKRTIENNPNQGQMKMKSKLIFLIRLSAKVRRKFSHRCSLSRLSRKLLWTWMMIFKAIRWLWKRGSSRFRNKIKGRRCSVSSLKSNKRLIKSWIGTSRSRISHKSSNRLTMSWIGSCRSRRWRRSRSLKSRS